MAFRNPIRSIPAAGIIGLITGSQLAADSIDGKTITGAEFQTAQNGSPRILIGPGAYNAGAPAVAWDMAGTGVDWLEPHISVDPADGSMYITGQMEMPSGANGSIALFGPTSQPGVKLDASGVDGVTLASLSVDGNTGQTLALGPVVAAGEPWIAPALTNGWANYGAGHRPAGYRKMADGTVMLRGLVKLGTLNAAIFTLPAGYRPGFEEVFTCMASAATNCRVDVFTDGTVKVLSYDTGGTNAFVSLADIRFSYTT